MDVVRAWFKVDGGVSRRFYFLTGLSLMLFKYGTDNLILWLVNGHLINPQSYLLPLINLRELIFTDTSTAFQLCFIAWCLPFAFIGGNLSMRRARDAGLPAAIGLLFFVPFLNFLAMLVLSTAPSKKSEHQNSDDAPEWRPPETESQPAPVDMQSVDPKDAVVAILIWHATAAVMLALTVYGLKSYGAALFLGSPFLMGFAATTGLNRTRMYTMRQSANVLALSCFINSGLFIAFALEGFICIMMAAPLVFAAGFAGGLMAWNLRQGRANAVVVMALSLPLMAFAEAPELSGRLRAVTSSMIVDAKPDKVWPNVIGFSEIEVPRPWYFRTGIAVPLRARIHGKGVGAVRHCEFTTGSFVEPITVWEPPKRLAFNVKAQPPTMEEWSPYSNIAPPHLEQQVLKSRRGEFLLEPLPEGKTQLTGTTWYTFDMAPTWYWNLWGDAIIHRIHQRVLTHVAQLSED